VENASGAPISCENFGGTKLVELQQPCPTESREVAPGEMSRTTMTAGEDTELQQSRDPRICTQWGHVRPLSLRSFGVSNDEFSLISATLTIFAHALYKIFLPRVSILERSHSPLPRTARWPHFFACP